MKMQKMRRKKNQRRVRKKWMRMMKTPRRDLLRKDRERLPLKIYSLTEETRIWISLWRN